MADTTAPKSPATKAPKAPALDFSTLAPVDADLPKSTRASKPNPFTAWLLESKESGKGKAVTVPNANVNEVVNLIRNAANREGIGSRIVQEPNGKGQTVVKFSGKARKAPRKGSDAAQG